LDQNDNSPFFTNPPKDGFIVGWPEAKLAEKLMPKYLFKVESFDIDEGLNAIVKYSLENYDHFTINSKSGIIYPLKNAMMNEDDVNIIIKATDRNGYGNVVETLVNVKKVEAENIVEMILKNEPLENAEIVIKEISEQTEIDLGIINYFAISSIEGKQINSESNILIYVYAFDEITLMKQEQIVEKLSKAQLNIEIDFSNFDSENIYKLSDCNATGLGK
jgi:hypothetical protein